MSRIYFHTPSGTAELHGSERAWLGHIGDGPGTYAWDFSRHDTDRAYWLVSVSPESPPGEHGANYLHALMRVAQTADRRYKEAWAAYEAAGRPDGPLGVPRFDPNPWHRFRTSLEVALRVNGLDITVAGHSLRTADLEANTALVAGSDPVALAAKLNHWCERHCWVEGGDRKWLAEVIDAGLAAGLYRRGFWYADTPDGPRDRWSDQGWDGVLELLRARDDEPVVLSYSVTERFPNREVAGWVPPMLPADWRPDWAKAGPGRAEWEALDDAGKAGYRDEAADEVWDALPDGEQWGRAMRGLREQRPWARLGPDTLREVTFGPSVTVYDLFAADRDERVTRACLVATDPESVEA